MDTASRSPRPGFSPALASFLIHHNPFYLLSALCMIAGCFALNRDLGLQPGELSRLLLLVGTLNVYELLLIALGLYLIRARGIERDGRTLLLLEAPLLVDLTFLNSEVAQAHGSAAIILNLLLLTLATLKVGVIFRVLYREFPLRIFGFVMLELVVLFAMPSVFKAITHFGSLTAAQMYFGWVIVALLPVVYEVARWVANQMPRSQRVAFDVPRRAFILRLYVTLPFISLIAHLAMLHWVYLSRFYLGDAALVSLGISLPLARMQPASAELRSAVMKLRIALPLVAIAMTLIDPVPLAMTVGGRTPVTPALFAAAGAYAIYVYVFLRRHALYYLLGGLSSGTMAMFLQWGVAAIAAGFAFLGIGAVISLRRPKVVPLAALPDVEMS
jgi:hypothetical protein